MSSLDCHSKFPAKRSPANEQHHSQAGKPVYYVHSPPIGWLSYATMFTHSKACSVDEDSAICVFAPLQFGRTFVIWYFVFLCGVLSA